MGVHINTYIGGYIPSLPYLHLMCFSMLSLMALKKKKQNGCEEGRLPEVISGMQLPRVWHLTPHLFPILCAVGRKQFMRFEWANHAAEALGCDYEELNTATFKHHLRQIIEQMTSGPQRQGLQDNEACSGIESSRLHYGGLDLAVAALVAAPHAFPCFLMFSKTPFECSVHMCRKSFRPVWCLWSNGSLWSGTKEATEPWEDPPRGEMGHSGSTQGFVFVRF